MNAIVSKWDSEAIDICGISQGILTEGELGTVPLLVLTSLD
jgi:hypothetical protein